MVGTPRPRLAAFGSVRLWAVVLAALSFVMYSSCGDDEFNLYSALGAKDLALQSNEQAKLEEARVHIDKEEYAEANKILQGLMEKEETDSNEARLLYAAAMLGDAGLDVWSIISEILDDTGKKSSRSGGLDTIFNTFSDSILGSGAERTKKMETLALAISNLLAAPLPSEKKVNNTACLLAGLLAVPTIADATAAVSNVTAALQQISAAASSGGETCPNTSLLDSSLEGIRAAAEDFNLVLTAASNCAFLDLESAEALMNQVEESLTRLRTNADKGCELPTCPAAVPNCASLFPKCVQEILAVGEHPEYVGNGSVESCEIVLNCTDPTECFD